MYSAYFRHYLILASILTITFFVGVMLLHPLAPHAHAHSHTVSDTAASVLHTGVVDRGQGVAAALLFFVIIVPAVKSSDGLLPAIFRRGVQDIDLRTFLPLQSALSRGVLHSKAY